MRKFNLSSVLVIMLLLMPLCYSAQEIKISGYVNDYANVISPEYKSQIDEILGNLYKKDISQFSVVTIKTLNGQDIESYTYNLANGVLGNKEKNNGLLLLVAIDDHKYRFEVGRGIEPILNDAKIGRIGRVYLTPNFKNNDYGKGIYEAASAVNMILLNGTITADITQNDFTSKPIFIIIFFVLIFLIPIITKIWAAKRLVKDIHDKNYFNAGMMAALLLSGRGRGGSGGFGGGSFGGFGGGSFGGGGSSGGW
jgi:uncharacterized protein